MKSLCVIRICLLGFCLALNGCGTVPKTKTLTSLPSFAPSSSVEEIRKAFKTPGIFQCIAHQEETVWQVEKFHFSSTNAPHLLFVFTNGTLSKIVKPPVIARERVEHEWGVTEQRVSYTPLDYLKLILEAKAF